MPSSSTSAFKGIKVLITSGPTAVPIDGTRVITNRSTGELGRLIAHSLAGLGSKVTLLEGPVTTRQSLPKGTLRKFYYFDDFAVQLERECLRGPAVVVHAAAVSDFTPVKIFKKKISSAAVFSLELRPTPKLVDVIKRWAPFARLVAFKLEDDLSPLSFRKAERLFSSARADLVLVNSVGSAYRARILRSDGEMTALLKTKQAAVNALVSEIRKTIL